MSTLRRNAIVESIGWFIVLITFFPIFFSNGGAEEFIKNETKRNITANIFLFGYCIHFLILWLTHRKKKLVKIVFDERDKETQRIANNIAFIFTLLYVFLLSIVLYDSFFKSEYIPVGYMWFVGYSTIAMTSFLSAFIILITDLKNS